MTERQFHDTLTAYNAISVEFIRAGMQNLALTRDTQAKWRFADTAQN